MKKIYLFGGGGHALSCIDVIERQKKFKILGIIDEKLESKQKILNYSIIKKSSLFKKKNNSNNYGLVAVGQIRTPKVRIKIFNELIKNSLLPATIISPLSSISKNAKIGEGTIVMHGCVINSKARIGKNCIINSGCIIEHEVEIGDHSHISTGTIINGRTKIGKQSFVGSGSILIQGISIGDGCVIGAGSLVKKNIINNKFFVR